jgi:hypothetical protein
MVQPIIDLAIIHVTSPSRAAFQKMLPVSAFDSPRYLSVYSSKPVVGMIGTSSSTGHHTLQERYVLYQRRIRCTPYY